MKKQHRRSKLRLPSSLGGAALAAMTVASQPALASEPNHLSSSVLLTEVLFDASGVDGSKIGGEWVELYVQTPTNLSGWSLRDNFGNLLAALPDITAPANSSIVIFLSSIAPYPHDQSFADRSAAFAAGLPAGDYLGNLSGGVRLTTPTGTVADCVYWGLGAPPPGAEGGPWPTGEFFDIAYAGGRPIVEGESLGRPADPLDGLTMTVADWDRCGGRNAAGATPGGRNGVHPTDAYGLVRQAQTGVNQVLGGLSATEAPGWIDVVNAHVDKIEVAYSSNSATVSALHTFELILRGVPATISGTLTASYVVSEIPGAVGFKYTTSGVLSGVTADGTLTFELEVDLSDVYSGFHTNTISIDGAVHCTLRCNGIEYPFSIDGDILYSRTGQDKYILLDRRTACDYGGAGEKASIALTEATRLSDGTYTTRFALDRTYPMLAPPISQAGAQVVMGTEQQFTEGGGITNDAGEITTGLVWRFDKLRNWNYTTVSMQPGQLGTFSLESIDGSLGKLGQHVRYRFDAPMRILGQDKDVAAEAVGTAYLAGGKYISEAYGKLTVDGEEVLRTSVYIDPPMQDVGCPHCASCRAGIIHMHLGCDICPQPAPPAPPQVPGPPPPPAQEPVGFTAALATCSSRGAAIGSGLGATAGFITGFFFGAGGGALPGMVGGAKTGGAGGAAVGIVTCAIGWSVGSFD